MERINHVEQNRPVHLAVRDVHFERAIELLAGACRTDGSKPLEKREYERILFLLRNAREHARFAACGKKRDEQFYDFIAMMAGNLKAVLSMLNLKSAVEKMEGFLGSDELQTVALQAGEYERRARDIVRCLYDTLDLAGKAYSDLKKLNWEHFNEREKTRYQTALDHYALLLDRRLEVPEYRKRVGLF